MADFRDLILATAPQPSPASSTYAAPFQMPTQEDLARRQEQQDKETLSQEYRNYERQYDDYLRANSSNIGAFTPLGKLSIDDWVKYRNNEYDSTMPLPKHMFFTPDMRKQLSEKPLIQAGAGEELGTRIAKASDGLTQGVRDWIHAITGIGYSREEQDKERVYRTQGNIEEKNRLERIKADLEAGKPLEDDDLEFLNEHDKPFLAQIWQGIKDTPEFAKELATNPEAMDMFVDESIRQLPAGVGLMAATKNPLAAVGNYAKTLSRIAGLKRNAQRAAKASKIKEAAKDAALATGSGGITEIAHGMGERSQESPAYTMAQNALLDGLVPLAASQIGKGMGRRIAGDGNKSGTEAETAEDPRFSLIGERGAEFSDFNNNTTEKKDKLITAKEMEASGKNASQIYYATGWEKGADGKWKYELPDLELKDRTFELFKSEHGIDIIKSRGLDELIDADELFRAHPDLRDIDVFYDRYGSGGSSYSDKTNTIRIGIPPNELTPDGIRKTLIHEIQHAIQHREGFASGGSPGEFRGEYDKLMNEIKQKNESMRIANNQGDSKLYDRLMSERNELTKKTLELQDEYGIVGYNQYRRLAGEVEARNVAKRSGISENVRDMIPFRQTEDVPRNEQIVRFHAASEAGISESHDTPAIREAARKAWREKGTDSPFFKRWFGDSKVVDEQGKPLVVYHGTNAEFTEFKNKNKYQNIQHEGYF
ncbi:MAG: hypothetical protein FWC26_04195, partial [Fibromonadales bacterium]|nr:hypothetical protein [Fibromonadales bacterium]